MAKLRPSGKIHAALRRARLAKGWSQLRLANEVGCHKTAVSHWETGLSAPGRRLLPAVAAKLGTTIGALYGEHA